MSPERYVVEIAPYSDEPRCVKCDSTQVRYSYGECAYTYGNGRLMSLTRPGDTTREPHLKCSCFVCDFEWLIRPADYADSHLSSQPENP